MEDDDSRLSKISHKKEANVYALRQTVQTTVSYTLRKFLLVWPIALKFPVMPLARAKVKCAINLFPLFIFYFDRLK